jgi:hypothetical protein
MPLRGRTVPQNLSILVPIHDLPRDLFAVLAGVAEHDLGRFGAFVIKLQVVFPGESDAAVNLRAAGADLSGGVGATGLADRECDGFGLARGW